MEIERSNNRLTIATQKGDGRLAAGTRQLLNRSDIEYSFPSRIDYASVEDFPLDLFQIRDDDIPVWVGEGFTDLGIVGYDMIKETQAAVVPLSPLDFSKCKMMLGVRSDIPYKNVWDLKGMTVATTFENCAREFFKSKRTRVNMLPLKGSVELALATRRAEACVDIVSSGESMYRNGIAQREKLFDSEAYLIANPRLCQKPELKETVEEFLIRLVSGMDIGKRRYIGLNAPAASRKPIVAAIPGAESPTVTTLEDQTWLDIQSMVDKDSYWKAVRGVQRQGGRDIVEFRLERVIPNPDDPRILRMMRAIYG